jgi:hypothetical protein
MPRVNGYRQTGRFAGLVRRQRPTGWGRPSPTRVDTPCLVGIAGEDDLDAPDTLIEPSEARAAVLQAEKPAKGIVNKPPVLSADLSGQLREKLLAEIGHLNGSDELALWAHRNLAAKNTLTADDARILEAAYQTIVDGLPSSEEPHTPPPISDRTQDDRQAETRVGDTKVNSLSPTDTSFVPYQAKPLRRRNKAHLAFVASQPFLICQRTPCDAHHLKFAQPKALGRKVSDEFTVPLCRDHHNELHGGSNEMAWWGNLQIAPVEIAKGLWQTGPAHRETTAIQTQV